MDSRDAGLGSGEMGWDPGDKRLGSHDKGRSPDDTGLNTYDTVLGRHDTCRRLRDRGLDGKNRLFSQSEGYGLGCASCRTAS
jgi:hypothetical protein